LFAHGFGCNQQMWRWVTPPFEDRYRTVVFDHLGCGESDSTAYDPVRHSTLDGYAEDVLAICHELDLEDVVYVGHSVSAMICALAAIREPQRCAGIVMIGPSPCYINEEGYHGGFERNDVLDLLYFLDSNYLGWSRTMAKVIMGNPEKPELAEQLENSFCQADPEIAKKFARVTFLSDHRQDLPKITSPTLILQCSEDPIAPIAVGEYTQRHIAGSELVVMKATGHCPNLSAPEETVTYMNRFLERLPG
jgi:sigma-B regulation protein RsbQ